MVSASFVFSIVVIISLQYLDWQRRAKLEIERVGLSAFCVTAKLGGPSWT